MEKNVNSADEINKCWSFISVLGMDKMDNVMFTCSRVRINHNSNRMQLITYIFKVMAIDYVYQNYDYITLYLLFN